jgi:hypothetical protein
VPKQCDGETVALTVDDVTECVPPEFRLYATEVIPGASWHEDTYQLNVETEIHHLAYFPEGQRELCPTAKFAIQGFSPLDFLCFEADLSLTLCAGDISTCVQRQHPFVKDARLSKNGNDYYADFTRCDGDFDTCTPPKKYIKTTQ